MFFTTSQAGQAGPAATLVDLLTGPTILSAEDPPLPDRTPRLRLDLALPATLNPANLGEANQFRDLLRRDDVRCLVIEERLNPETGTVNGRDSGKRQKLELLPGDAAGPDADERLVLRPVRPQEGDGRIEHGNAQVLARRALERGNQSYGGGDLRLGLALQSLHDGRRWVHEPLRLSVFIEAPAEAIDDVIAGNAMVNELVTNEWLHLFRVTDDGDVQRRLQPGGWEVAP